MQRNGVPTRTNGITIWGLSQGCTRRNCNMSEDAHLPAAGRKDPVKLYYSLLLGL